MPSTKFWEDTQDTCYFRSEKKSLMEISKSASILLEKNILRMGSGKEMWAEQNSRDL